MNDFEIRLKTLLNEHVDAELGPRRAAPHRRAVPSAPRVFVSRGGRLLPLLAAACVVVAVAALLLAVGRMHDDSRPASPPSQGWRPVVLPTVQGRTLFGEPTVGFADPKHAWIVGTIASRTHRNPLLAVWTTSDGGRGWTLHLPYLRSVDTGTYVSFVDATHGWLAQGHDIYVTADGGATWTRQTTVGATLVDIATVDRTHAWAVGDDGSLARTTDGIRWAELATPPHTYPPEMQFVDPDHGWLDLGKQGLYATADGGTTWSPLPDPARRAVYGLSFVSPQVGWIIDPFAVFKTSDGGQSWHRQLSTSGYLEDSAFADAQHGWVFGQRAALRTNDSGRTWTEADLPSRGVLHAAARGCVTLAASTSHVFRYARCGG